MTYRVDSDLKNLIREDLPEDIHAVVDQVVTATEKAADEIFNQFSDNLKGKLNAFDKESQEVIDKFDTEIDAITKDLESSLDSISTQTKELEKLQAQLTAHLENPGDQKIDLAKLDDAIKSLNTAVANQRGKISKIGKLTGQLTGSLARRAISLV